LATDGFGDIASAITQELHSLPSKFLISDLPKNELIIYGLEDIKPNQILFRADKKDIAEQLTIIDFEIYQKIDYRELVGLKWTKDKLNIFAPNVLGLLKRANKISYWVATYILLQENQADRVKAIAKMIGVAKSLTDMKNYNSMMGVLAGLGLSCITRLKQAFLALPKSSNEKLHRLAQFQDPAAGFRFLRNYTKEQGALLPYLGIYLADLVNIDENTDFMEVSGKNLINFFKPQIVSNSIKNLLQYSTVVPKLEQQEPLYTFLYELPSLDDNALYKLSTEREPRQLSVQ